MVDNDSITSNYNDVLIGQQSPIAHKNRTSSEKEISVDLENEKYLAKGNGKANKNLKVNRNSQHNKEQKEPHYKYLQKFHHGDSLFEAVIVGDIPYFAVARSNCNDIVLRGSVRITDNIEYRPCELTSYLNEPYKFKSKQEFESLVEKAKNETLDTIYRKVRSIWSKYIDADDFHISICAADTVFTYYQDKIGLTHYLFFIGSPGCGKSNNLTVFKFLAYRNFTSTDLTAANIYQFLGSGEEGQGTLCEDEADRIDEDRQKMAIYKNGYITGFPVARTDTSNGRAQHKFNTFCFKAFAAEKFPDSTKAKAFNQRLVELQSSFGDPEYDITEVVTPGGEQEFQDLLDELNETRNLLLLYRLLHNSDKIPDVKLNIKGREKQLFKSILRVFQDTETVTELLPVVSRYVTQKREMNNSSWHAFLYRIIRDLINDQKNPLVGSGEIWEYIKSNLRGEDIPGKKMSYETEEYGTISHKDTIQTLEHIFGAKINKFDGIRKVSFSLTNLQRLGKVYDLDLKVKVMRKGENEEKSGSVGTLWPDIGLDKHITPVSSNEKFLDNSQTSTEDQDIGTGNSEENTTENKSKDLEPPQKPSKPSKPSKPPLFSCYHKDCDFQTDDERDYRRHWGQKHSGIPVLYPTKAELEKYSLKPQGKSWEI